MFTSFGGSFGRSVTGGSIYNNNHNVKVYDNKQNNHNVTNTDDCFDSPFKDLLLSIFWFLAR